MTALPDPAEGPELGVDQVHQLAGIIAGGECLLIDCREEEEWQFNRLPNARWIPLSSFAEQAAGLPAEGKPVIVYCHHGMRSLRATHWLRAHGLESTWSMTGGIDAWSERIDADVPRY